MKKLFLFLIPLLFLGCKKDEFTEILVPGNVAPPDPTISNVAKENYVNKVYIAVLGRKATEAEFNESYDLLDVGNLSMASRRQMLDIVLAKPEYFYRAYNIARGELLENNDSTDIVNAIDVFNFLLTDASYQNLWPAITIERDRLIILQNTSSEFAAGNIGIREVHRRLLDNYFYDQINMGTENFVVSSFQHFFYRYPSVAELGGGSQMVDGLSSYLFLQPGNSKSDYLTILLGSGSYYEGQVRNLFNRYLFRDPTTSEVQDFASAYKSNDNYKELQKSILALDEFAGL